MKRKIVISTLALLVIFGLVMGLSQVMVPASQVQADTDTPPPKQGTISTAGNALMRVEPDLARISVGVMTFDESPKEAQKQNAEKMDKVFARLEELGIEESLIKTVQYDISPRYEWKEIEVRVDEDRMERKSERVIVGYEVHNTIRITVLDLDMVGVVIDMTVEEGINKANAVAFDLSDQKRQEVYLQVLEMAVINAKQKAETIASVYDIQLGKPISVVEAGSYIPSPIMHDRMQYQLEFESADQVKTPIAAGEMEIRANVNVVYAYDLD